MNRSALSSLETILGKDHLLTAPEDRIGYSYDASGQTTLPDAVLFPHTADQVSAILKIANRHNIPVVPRGAGSGLTGGALPCSKGIVLAMDRFDAILDLDTDNFQVIVQPGVVTSAIHRAVEKEGLFYPPDPASQDFSTIGGNIAENAGGMRAVKYGVTKDYVMGLEVVLADGEIVHTGSKCIKDVVGYDMTRLFVGSEGTLGIVTQAILKLIPLPRAKLTLTASFASLEKAAETVPALLKSGIIPTTLEYVDKNCIKALERYMETGLPTGSEAMLLIEVDGTKEETCKAMDQVRQVVKETGATGIRVAETQADQDRLWSLRRSIHASLQLLKPEWLEEDVAVPIARIPRFIRKLDTIARQRNLLVASFGHAGDGNIHLSFAEKGDRQDKDRLEQARAEILRAAIDLEGRIAAEHGIGIAKREKIGWNLDPATLGLMVRLKRMLDPNNILNPGKVFPSKLC